MHLIRRPLVLLSLLALAACGGGDLVLPNEGQPANVKPFSGDSQTGTILEAAAGVAGRAGDRSLRQPRSQRRDRVGGGERRRGPADLVGDRQRRPRRHPAILGEQPGATARRRWRRRSPRTSSPSARPPWRRSWCCVDAAGGHRVLGRGHRSPARAAAPGSGRKSAGETGRLGHRSDRDGRRQPARRHHPFERCRRASSPSPTSRSSARPAHGRSSSRRPAIRPPSAPRVARRRRAGLRRRSRPATARRAAVGTAVDTRARRPGAGRGRHAGRRRRVTFAVAVGRWHRRRRRRGDRRRRRGHGRELDPRRRHRRQHPHRHGPGRRCLGQSRRFTATATPGAPSRERSTVSAAPGASPRPAGSVGSAITVIVRDSRGNPLAGRSRPLSATGSGVTLTQPGATDASGATTARFSATGAGDHVVTAETGGVTLGSATVR